MLSPSINPSLARAAASLTLAAGLALPIIGASHSRSPSSVRAEPGRLTGTVILSHALAARRPRFRIYTDAGQGSTPPSKLAPDLKEEFANVVIYLELDGDKGLAAGPNSHPQKRSMAQRGEQFVPHTVAVVQGTTVDFPNEDDVFHNIFSLSGTKHFDLPKYPAGASKSVTFPRAGVVNVFCHIHADMSGVVLVRDNPYFVSPDTTGSYALEAVPPGDYTLVAWHERTKPTRAKVKITAGQTTRVTFSIPLPAVVER